jgi:D-alanyl-D-alanine carboxypeptidase
MNRWARLYEMENTVYANPHGLQNTCNKSTARDCAKIAYQIVQVSGLFSFFYFLIKEIE